MNYSDFCSFSAPPSPPVNLKPSKIGEDFVDLEWKPPKNDGGSKITKYILKKKVKLTGAWEEIEKIDSLDTKYRVKKLKPNTEYYFAVFAENAAGISDSCESKKVIPVREPSK